VIFKDVEHALLYYHFFEMLKAEVANWHMKNVSRNFKEDME